MAKLKSSFAFVLIAMLSGLFVVQILQMLYPDGTDIKAEAAGPQEVVINEIAWMGTEVSANDEWVELKNLTTTEIDLNGWKLIAADGIPAINLSGTIAANNYYLLERTSDETVPGVAGDQIFVGALGNAGEKLELRDASNNLIDSLEALSGWPAGDNTTKATMERKADGTWQASLNPGGTPRGDNSGGALVEPDAICGNGSLEDAEECDDGNNTNGDGCSNDCNIEEAQATTTEDVDEQSDVISDENPPHPNPLLGKERGIAGYGDVVINELVSDPADGEEEWVEIYNTSWEIVDLAGWTLTEGSGAKTTLAGSLGATGANRFLVITKPKGNLNNKGDAVILKDNSGKIIDQVTYGDWDDGNLDNNATVAVDPYSLARRYDGYNTGNNANDFANTKTVTKGKSNVVSNPEEDEEISDENKKLFDYSDGIIISEIFPNPKGSDNESEYIELHNESGRDVNLLGWSLGDESKRKFEIKDKKIIRAGQYLALYRSETRIALNNGGDSAMLYQPLKDSPLQAVKFTKGAEGWSYVAVRIATSVTSLPSFAKEGDEWVWTEVVTPGAANIIKTVNHGPEVDFDCPVTVQVGEPALFDSSDTIDADGDELKFAWDFGDGLKNNLSSPQHTYLKSGIYTVELTVDDGTNKVKKEKTIKVVSDMAEVLGWSGGVNNDGSVTLDNIASSNKVPIIINEIMPDPEGSDGTGEWIELYNQSGTKINLLDWRLEDSRGEDGDYKFKDNQWLDMNKFLVIGRPESKLALNNDGDFVRLYDSNNDLLDEVKYKKSIAGQALAKTPAGDWQWTTKATPGKQNQFVAAQTANKTAAAAVTKAKSKILLDITLEQINELAVGDLVKVKGTVAVLPGVFGTQYFYIVGSPGVQIYSYKKDFPALKIGDLVEVTGEVSEVAGEKRIKTSQASDINVLEHKAAPVPIIKTCEELNSELCGQLVTVDGEIADRKGSTVYLDDGTEEAIVYLKKGAGINTTGLKPGDKVAVTGIVSLASTGARLMPRSPEDIVKKDVAGGDGQVLGETATGDVWQIENRDKKMELLKYLLILAGGAVIVLVGLLIKIQWQKPENKETKK